MRNVVIDICDKCVVTVEKREDGYYVEIVTDNNEIVIVCDRLTLHDKRPKPVKPLTTFVEDGNDERCG